MPTSRFPRIPTAILTGLLLIASIAGCGGGPGGDGSEVRDPNPGESRVDTIIARVGPILAIRVGETAWPEDRNSFTTLAQPLQFRWSFSHRPDGSKAVLQGANSPNPSFVADIKGTYMVQLVVSAGSMTSKRAIQQVVVTDPGERPTGPFNHPGLSSSCLNCHNSELPLASGTGSIPGKSADHLATGNSCETCHTPQGFAIIPFVDHQEVFGNCSGCHDGVTAIGKSEFHTQTEAECDDCHNTTHFLELNPDGSFDHSGISRACTGCHNGVISRGKTPTPPHPDTDIECGFCHTTTTFLGAYPDHTNPAVLAPGCDSCHGVSATGEPAGHPAMNVDCGSCHGIATFSLGGVFNHRIDPTVQSCETCHNDNSNTNFNGLAPGKATAVPTHLTTSGDCGNCHNTDTFTPAFFNGVGGLVDHNDPNLLALRCDSCHGVNATGKSANHMPTSEDCVVCHTPGGTFTTGVFTHGAGYLSSYACEDCHNDTISVGKLPNHFPTNLGTDQNCVNCHNTTSFAGASFDHAGVGTNSCNQCHNGDYETTANTLYGKPVTHIPTTQQCSTCHVVGDAFAPAVNFAHTGISNNCESCHNGNSNYVAVGAIGKNYNGHKHIPASDQCENCHVDKTAGGFASNTFFPTQHDSITNGCEGCHVSKFFPARPELTKTADHLPTNQDCDLCHTVAGFGPPTTFAHTGISGNCASCHDGSPGFVALGALGKTPSPPHPDTTSDCVICHNTSNFADAFVDHTDPAVLGQRCDNCHNGVDAIGMNSKPDHVPTTEDCRTCHTAGGAFKPAVFDHGGITDNCVSCHDGVYATGTDAKPNHIPIGSQDCSVCHTPTAFANATFEHQGIVDNCKSCHNGINATGKNNSHVPTNDDCSNCHVTTGFKPATFDHVGIVDNCASCHDAGFATPKSANHLDTNQDCGICHNTGAFKPATFDHSGIVDNCVSCHDGDKAKGMIDAVPAHIPTSLDCHFCHTTSTFAGGTWVHDASTANNCDSCHYSGGPATSKGSGHLSTTEQCDVCHNTNGWAPTNFSHPANSAYNVPYRLDGHRRNLGCNDCHGTTISGGSGFPWRPARSPQYAPYCAACHSNRFRSKDKHIGGKSGTVEQNKDCSGGGRGCHRIGDSNFD